MTQDGMRASVSPSVGTDLRSDTMPLDMTSLQVEQGQDLAAQGSEWVLRAPCGSAVLDAAVSPADAARVLALLREIKIEVVPAPQPPEAEAPAGSTESSWSAGSAGSAESAGAGAKAPRHLAEVEAAPAAQTVPEAHDEHPGHADTRVWLDPDDVRPLDHPDHPDQQGPPGDEADGDDALVAAETLGEGGCGNSGSIGDSQATQYYGPYGQEQQELQPAAASASPAETSSAASQPQPGHGAEGQGRRRRSTGAHAANPGLSMSSAPGAADSSQEAGGGQADSAAPPGLSEPPLVRGWKCVAGHMNPEGTYSCLQCAQPVTTVLVNGPRPALVSMAVSTGEVIAVNGTVVVGRAPKGQGEPAQLVTVPSPTHLVSRSHLLITTTGWTVLARDLGSSNGTVLVRPGQAPVLIATALPTPLVVGDLLDIGDGMTLRIDAPAGPAGQ